MSNFTNPQENDKYMASCQISCSQESNIAIQVVQRIAMVTQPTISKFFKCLKNHEKDLTKKKANAPPLLKDISSGSDEETKRRGNSDSTNFGVDLTLQEETTQPTSNYGDGTTVLIDTDESLPLQSLSKRTKKRSESFAENGDYSNAEIMKVSQANKGVDSYIKQSRKKSKVTTNECALTPLDQQVKELKQLNKDKLLVVRVGYKYKCFAEDAVTASRILHIKLIPGKISFDSSNSQDCHHKQFAYCSFPDSRLNVHLERLVHYNIKVGVVEQSETSAMKKYAKDSNKSLVFGREVTSTFSKTTYGMNNLLISDARRTLGDMSSIWALSSSMTKNNRCLYWLISVNLNSGEVVYDQFEQAISSTDELDLRLRYLDPKELITSQKLSPLLFQFFSKRDCTIHQSFFEGPNSSLVDICAQINLSAEFSKLIYQLFEYLKDYGNERLLLIPSAYQPFFSKTHILLNTNTLQSLDIFANNGGKGSLFWLLDHTRTAFGCRQLRQWILRPLLSKKDIEDRLDATECVKSEVNHLFFESLNQMLKNTSDLLRTLNRISYGRTSRKEVYYFLKQISLIGTHFETHFTYLRTQLYSEDGGILKNSILLAKVLKGLLEYSRCMKIPHLLSMINVSAVMEKDVEKQITGFFNLSNYDNSEQIIQRQREIGAVRDELYDELSSIRRLLRRPHLNFKDDISFLIEIRNSQINGLPSDWVKVNSTKMVSRFHTPNIVRLIEKLQYNNDLLLQVADGEYKRFLKSIIEDYAALKSFIKDIGIYDSILALSATSCNKNYVRPIFNDERHFLKAIKARNPIIESLDVNYVPNDINMSEKDGKVLILTGPNMGGKSSYVRQVALCVILAQIGSFVPADYMELGIFDNIFTRVGAYDNLLRGESTFKIEMSEILQIIKNYSSRSLLLLDEVGRGTSTEDGKAIAYTLLEYFLAQQNCPLILFTTHYPILGSIPSKQLSTYYMDYVEEKKQGEEWSSVIFLYKLKAGITHNSYGLNVARLAQIDKNIIKRAFEVSDTMRKESEINEFLDLPIRIKGILNSEVTRSSQKLAKISRVIKQDNT